MILWPKNRSVELTSSSSSSIALLYKLSSVRIKFSSFCLFPFAEILTLTPDNKFKLKEILI